ncbi:MAG: GDP-mannose 4,6-dehydratase [Candidatus Daviesbacteria bacterium]|nr:GDP-mannose 4,6-dehydratase [Candidatus Daviesbacteria bacterium]
MKILVTGGAGFIGHHFIEHILRETDWEIIILDRLSHVGSMKRIVDIDGWEGYKDRVRLVWHDLRGAINSTTSSGIGKVGHIFHFASSSHVEDSIKDPMRFIMDNEIGSCNLMLWALDNLESGGKFFNFSTDEVFGSAPNRYAYKEGDRWRPSNPYSASKAGQSGMGYAFWNTYGLPVISTFTMNNFGERQHSNKFIPLIVKNILNCYPVNIHCKIVDGKPVEIGQRTWLHCRNTASALLFLTEKGSPGEFYNIIGFDEWDNEALAKLVGDIMDREVKFNYIDFHSVRKGHDRRYALDGTKLKNMGWNPPVSFDNGLKKTINWMTNVKNLKWLELGV